MSDHLVKESSRLDLRLYLDCPTKTWTLSVCVWKKKLRVSSAALRVSLLPLQLSVGLHSQQVCFISL